MKTTLIFAAAAFGLAATGVQAKTSSTAELRGYNTCLTAAERDSNGLVPSRHYLVDHQDGNALYYVNATRWQQGDREAVRIACETTQRGARLLSAVTEPGRWVNSRVTVEVAQQ